MPRRRRRARIDIKRNALPMPENWTRVSHDRFTQPRDFQIVLTTSHQTDCATAHGKPDSLRLGLSGSRVASSRYAVATELRMRILLAYVFTPDNDYAVLVPSNLHPCWRCRTHPSGHIAINRVRCLMVDSIVGLGTSNVRPSRLCIQFCGRDRAAARRRLGSGARGKGLSIRPWL